MPRFAITKRGDMPPLSNKVPGDLNTSLDTASFTPQSPGGVEDILSSSLSSSSPSRKRATKPTISSASAKPENQDTSGPSGTLYLVAVPIGCLDDISLRALRTLREAALILCENVTVARSLTEHFGIETSLLRYDEQAKSRKCNVWLDRLLGGEDITFICDAGTPGIADPGQVLVRTALRHSIPVVAVPGPVAALVALVASGLPAERFAFDGFPPRNRAKREAFFNGLEAEERTLVLYERAGALVSTLKALYANGNPARHAAIADHLTYPAENWFRGTLQEAIAHFQKHRPRGEYTLVIEGSAKRSAQRKGV